MAVTKDDVLKELKGAARQGRISCALALSTAFRCGVTPGDAGTCLDELEIRIDSCQLGLFGYGPGKQKRIQMPETISREVAAWMVECADARGHITCKEIFAKAKEDGLSRALLAGACEKTGVKIRACQLGAFF